MKPTALIPVFPGTNAHHELAEAFRLAGAKPELVPIELLVDRAIRLHQADLLGWAGGFSYGDHLRSGAIAANDLLQILREDLDLAFEKQIPMIGICNGFQILVELGLLPGDSSIGEPTAVLDRNRSAKFEHLCEVKVCFKQPAGEPCIWLTEVEGQTITLPVAHGEGYPEVHDNPNHRVVATYGTPEGDASSSPNGSPIAALCSPNGVILGLMPHPERRVDTLRGGDQALGIFRAGVQAVR